MFNITTAIATILEYCAVRECAEEVWAGKTYTPSNIKNKVSSAANWPSQPWAISTTRKILLIRMQVVLIASAHRNALKRLLCRSFACVGSSCTPDLRRCTTLQPYSAQRSMKSTRVTTWNDNPTNITFVPGCGLLLLFEAIAAIPPPADCRSREKKSHTTKM